MKPRRRLLVDIDVLAGALAMSRRQAYALVAEGVLPRAARGKYDLPHCTAAYIEHLRSERGDPDATALRRAKAERAQLELEVRRREVEHESNGDAVVSMSDAVQLFAEATQVFYREILSVSRRAAPRLADITQPAILEDALDTELRAALRQGYDVGLHKLLEGDAA
jgi:hypothetical protein